MRGIDGSDCFALLCRGMASLGFRTVRTKKGGRVSLVADKASGSGQTLAQDSTGVAEH